MMEGQNGDGPVDDRQKVIQAVENTDLTIPTEKDPEWYRAVTYLRASGAEPEQIALMLGKDTTDIKLCLGLERVQQHIFAIQKRNAGKDYKYLFQQMTPIAAETVHAVMTDPSEKGSTRLAAASEVLDRSMGKPNQNVDVSGGSLIRELFQKIDNIDEALAGRAIAATASRGNNDFEEGEIVAETVKVEEPAAEKDPHAAWVEENLK